MTPESLIAQDFGLIADLIHAHAVQRPQHPALVRDDTVLRYGELDALMDRIAAALQRDGVRAGESIAICATASVEYGVVFLGALRAGVVVAPLAPSSTPESLGIMLRDCGAKSVFLDQSTAAAIDAAQVPVPRISLDGSPAGQPLSAWLAPPDAKPQPVTIDPAAPFNIIYSSGTTGAPKGIVQAHRMRWAHVRRAAGSGYDTQAVTLCSTPLYSNTTLVSFFPALAGGGTVVLMPKFDATKFLQLAQKHRATHAMLVPVQYQRLMDLPDFDRYDLGSFRMKFCTSAPFSAALKRDILRRWPGGLTEYYGMTEGGGTCILAAHEFPSKLHTVGRPAEGHDIRLIDEQGNEVAAGDIGEVVGRSPAAMMNGYFNQPQKTSEAEWYDRDGNRFIRTGDVGRFDAEGFLTLMDRKKDMIISGGFNIYPSDLEAVLFQHDAVKDAAVVGVPSREWGETPVAFVELQAGRSDAPEAIRQWVNQRVGKTQRLSALEIVSSLPRSAIGKVLKRELRDGYVAS
ncbi:MAG TPA: class I adenylate-forming enzyme family protein [Povalibacter sp.]|uniref:class I adenylate-forming enzyme family protein n=1 Tax=Povalibacter sp. TaxID=1962978 RepID=UPI002CF813C7|nr:class I adenylate-forming enzyme family protein [Povalibacter sp.]HMN45084.1 class I adenylate-forming enzyme family protein [Povalibacter sp.]